MTPTTTPTTTPVKKRGRKPKNEYYLNKQPDTVDTGNSAVIIYLPISLEKCLNASNSISLVDFPNILSASNDFLGYFPENHYRKAKLLEYNVIDSFEPESVHTDSLYINETEQIVTEIYDSSLVTTLKPCEFSVNINCFWCCHQFVSRPIFMPMSYNHKKEQFNVKGCFCSFNCCMAYMDDSVKYKGKRYLLSHMYRVFTKDMAPLDISPAPPRELLKIFGGCLTIDEFRSSSGEQIKFQIQEYPISYVPTQIKKTSVLVKEKTKKILPILDFTRPISVKNSLSKIISQKN